MAEQTKISTFLMFDNRAEEAIKHYVTLFDDGRIIELIRYGTNGPGREGSVQRAKFALGGQTIMATDSPIEHQIGHNPYLSLFVQCSCEAEIERLYAALSEGGSTPMPLGSYGFSARFAWVTDRYGIPWQLNLQDADSDCAQP